jgi:hexosaminidase
MFFFFRELYYKDEVKGLVMYARQRGVLLVPEFDAPAHASAGWQFGPESNLGNLLNPSYWKVGI